MKDADSTHALLGELSRRYGFSPAAVDALLHAVNAGHGVMAQFEHPEFGGHGQWIRGGMTMIANFSDASLKERVRKLCEEIAQRSVTGRATADGATAPAADGGRADWWPGALGRPDSAGAQNGMRYAYFAAARRLAIDAGAGIDVYDTLDHRIGGVSQQQSRDTSLRFTSQRGDVDVAQLPLVAGGR